MTMTPADVRAVAFAPAPRFRRGYDMSAVDAFLDAIALRLETGEGVTSNDVYHVTFAPSGIGNRGYAESDVDRFLTEVHTELLRLEDSWGHERSADPAVTDPAEVDRVELPADGEALAEAAAVDEPGDGSTDPR